MESELHINMYWMHVHCRGGLYWDVHCTAMCVHPQRPKDFSRTKRFIEANIEANTTPKASVATPKQFCPLILLIL